MLKPLRVYRAYVEKGEFDWTWAVPLPFVAANSDRSQVIMPASPVQDEEFGPGSRDQRLGYYGSLQAFLTYSFAWARHDKGLCWWLDNGRPMDDRRFRLIADSWGRDGALEGYASWWAKQYRQDPPSFEPLREWAHADFRPMDRNPTLEAAAGKSALAWVWSGGFDPLHIWGSGYVDQPVESHAGSEDHASAEISGVKVNERRAIFIAPDEVGWYRRLHELGAALPELPNQRSWRVDVFVKTIGFLGTYRKSWKTGLWFAGQHKYHSIGN